MEKRHRRIPMDKIHETPADGYYLPKKEVRFYALGAVLSAVLFYLVGFLRGKWRH